MEDLEVGVRTELELIDSPEGAVEEEVAVVVEGNGLDDTGGLQPRNLLSARRIQEGNPVLVGVRCADIASRTECQHTPVG